MAVRVPPARLLDSLSGGLRVPRLTKAGAATILVGLMADLVEHTLVPHAHDAVVAGFPVGEHAAHLVVLIGMVMVLAGVVADGVRAARRLDRREGSQSDAIR
jgi:hypothetical protein